MSRLHWYGPPYGGKRGQRRLYDPPSRWARYRLYIPDEQYEPGSNRTLRDRHGTYVWMVTDCGWEWMETRPVIRNLVPLRWLFGRLHEHVHTPGSWP